MKKKELKKQIDLLHKRVLALELIVKDCHYCENFKPKTVKFTRWEPLPMEPLKEKGDGSLLEKYLARREKYYESCLVFQVKGKNGTCISKGTEQCANCPCSKNYQEILEREEKCKEK